MSVECADK